MAFVRADHALAQLSFGHASAEEAVGALDASGLEGSTRGPENDPLARRLTAYARGVADDFCDVRVAPGRRTDLQRQILDQCRKIPYGETLTYGQLATKVGFPGAARAVGNCMAANPIPLVIPCHRVVPARGQPGRYSAPGGATMKRKLLTMEATVAARGELG